MQQDIRWLQRLDSYRRAMNKLEAAVSLSGERALSDLEQQGLIQAFEFTHELAWNCIRDYLSYQGEQNLFGSRDATRRAFQLGLIDNGEVWMDMITSRNLSSHTYNKATADRIGREITGRYFACFEQLLGCLNELAERE